MQNDLTIWLQTSWGVTDASRRGRSAKVVGNIPNLWEFTYQTCIELLNEDMCTVWSALAGSE